VPAFLRFCGGRSTNRHGQWFGNRARRRGKTLCRGERGTVRVLLPLPLDVNTPKLCSSSRESMRDAA